ncbi:MAG: peptidyl-prolyl cis-trans isomerase [Planctomycetes bacterium]|nr:peptidyl-prolyl cis-trans isomerase [Planctomycetota bacterium]
MTAVLATLSLFFLIPAVSAGDSPNQSGQGSQPPYARVRVAIPSSGGVIPVQETPATPAIPAAATPPPPPLPEPQPFQATSTPDAGDGRSVQFGASAADDMKNEPLVLAVIDGNSITDLDVMRELWTSRGQETLDWMIGRAILEKELSRLGLTVADSDVEMRLREHLEGLARAFPNLTGADTLARAASGMRLDEYRARSVWVELALRKIMQVTFQPTDDQLRAYYAEKQADFIQPEKVRISQVFIAPHPDPNHDDAPGPADWALAEKQIIEAHTRLRLGESFAEVAKTYGAGGNFSRWIGRGELLRELEEAAFSIRPGSISSPIRSSMGFHILSSEERRERMVPKFEEVRNQVLVMYEDRFFLLMAGEFMIRLRDNAIRGGGLVVTDQPKLFPDENRN